MKAATSTYTPRGCSRAFQSTPPVKAATALIAVVVHNIIFQSTPPVKAATYGCIIKARKGKISIHAAREGGDSGRGIVEWDEVISIHAAREGGDTTFSTSSSVRPSFQSTPPVKAATAVIIISVFVLFDFNPRRP